MPGLADAAFIASDGRPGLVEILQQRAPAFTHEARGEKLDDRPGALEGQGVASRLMKREQRLEHMHVRILTPWRDGHDVSLKKASIWVRPVFEEPVCQGKSSVEIISALKGCAGVSEAKRHEGGVVKVTSAIEDLSIRAEGMNRTAVGPEPARDEDLRASFDSLAPGACPAEATRHSVHKGLTGLRANATRDEGGGSIKPDPFVEALGPGIETDVPPEGERMIEQPFSGVGGASDDGLKFGHGALLSGMRQGRR